MSVTGLAGSVGSLAPRWSMVPRTSAGWPGCHMESVVYLCLGTEVVSGLRDLNRVQTSLGRSLSKQETG